MGKEKKMVSLKDIPDDVRAIIQSKYPYGFGNDETIKIKLGDKTLHALVVDTESITYLVKVNMEKGKVQPQEIEGIDNYKFKNLD